MKFFSIPDSLYNREINHAMLKALDCHKEWFYDDTVIETVYGCPFSCAWNGNRSDDAYMMPSLGFVRQVYDMYEEFGLKYKLTFTNFLLKPDHLYDVCSNKFAEILSKDGGYVTLSTPMMAEHIRNHYPKLKICWSVTTIYEKGIVSINELLDEGMIVVLPIDYNNHFDELVKFHHPENIEIILNVDCIDNCPYGRQHYVEINQRMMMETDTLANVCVIPTINHPEFPKNRVVKRDMMDDYEKLGINHFEIAGRIMKENLLEIYQHYLLLPEYGEIFAEYFRDVANVGWLPPQ